MGVAVAREIVGVMGVVLSIATVIQGVNWVYLFVTDKAIVCMAEVSAAAQKLAIIGVDMLINGTNLGSSALGAMGMSVQSADKRGVAAGSVGMRGDIAIAVIVENKGIVIAVIVDIDDG